jgi:tetratricopeptide (TPR) repeat protein
VAPAPPVVEWKPAPPPPEPAPAPISAAAEGELVSPTLAELYFNQGFPEKAIEVYRRLLERDPGNERIRARVAELQQPAAAPRADAAVAAASAAPPATAAAAPAVTTAAAPVAPARNEPAAGSPDESARAARRQALERTIERLESLRAALQKGAR